jgi:hypothetical protein
MRKRLGAAALGCGIFVCALAIGASANNSPKLSFTRPISSPVLLGNDDGFFAS